MGQPSGSSQDRVVTEIHRLLIHADDVRKAAPSRSQPAAAREEVMRLLDLARDRAADIPDADERRKQIVAISERVADLDLDALAPLLAPGADVNAAPTQVDDPSRVPPGQHLTAGWPVLHVGRTPAIDAAEVRVAVTGQVRRRSVFDLADLRRLGEVIITADLHCVTRWTRLDNVWTGVRVRDVIDDAGPHPSASHVIVSGHPAYSANLDLEVVRADDVLLAWDHDGQPLAREHGGPLRLVVPSRYGWKSVKWVFELRLTDRDVPGYWEERGYHDVADPWREQRFR